MPDSFKNRLLEGMRIRNLRASDLSTITGLSKPRISQYTNGVYEAKQDALHKLAIALNVSESWLMGYDVPMERPGEQKKNDELAMLVVKLRRDPDLQETVKDLADLTPEQRAAVKPVISALKNKQ